MCVCVRMCVCVCVCVVVVEKLGVEPETVRHGVEGLMFLITECSKLMVPHTSICNCRGLLVD